MSSNPFVGMKNRRTKSLVENCVNSPILHPYRSIKCRNQRAGDLTEGATHFWVRDPSASGSIQWGLFLPKCIAPNIMGGREPSTTWLATEANAPVSRQLWAVNAFSFELFTFDYPLFPPFGFCLLAFIHYNLLVTFTVFPRFNR